MQLKDNLPNQHSQMQNYANKMQTVSQSHNGNFFGTIVSE